MKNILLLETIAEEALNLLKSRSDFNLIEAYNPNVDVENALPTIDAVITRGKGQVNSEFLQKSKNLAIVARCGVGLDNVNINACTAQNIKVVNAPGSNAATIAEHTIALMLMLQRNMFTAVSSVKDNNWNARNTFEGDELNTKTLGIIGLGNIGLKVAKIADAMGMQVIYHSEGPENPNFKSVSLEELLKTADIITLHVPLLPSTDKMIDSKNLELVKKGALLINTARGQLINEDDLIAALNSGRLGGFAADVLSVEPPAMNDKLATHPKSLISAHVGSLSKTTYVKMCVSTVQNVIKILDNGTPEKGCIFNEKSLTGL